tara:strand:+ start:99 stop:548 length:450 start_codon:yes stop_codon:yes gene_type:complete
MSKYNYSTKEYSKEHMARAIGKDLGLSTKQAIEISKHLRNRKLIDAKKYLQEVIDGKRAVTFTRFNMNVGHKTKIGPGRYPIKASNIILQMLNSVESNAQFKGLNTNEIYIKAIIPQKGAAQYRYGRKFGRKMKRTHLEIVVEERAEKK